MDDKHWNRFERGLKVSIIPIIMIILGVIMWDRHNFFKMIFIWQLQAIGTYLEGLLIEKLYMRRR